MCSNSKFKLLSDGGIAIPEILTVQGPQFVNGVKLLDKRFVTTTESVVTVRSTHKMPNRVKAFGCDTFDRGEQVHGMIDKE